MTHPVRIPADVDREDRVFASLTARQLAILAGTAFALYGVWLLTHTFLPIAVFLVIALPVGATAAVLALGQRDGLSLDRLLLAAVRQRLQPRHRVVAPEGVQAVPDWLSPAVNDEVSPAPLRLPAQNVTEAGVIDLGTDGLTLVAVASTVSFALRTPGEQDALVVSFGRYLHSLTAPVQVLIRTERLDLSPQIAALRDTAAGLPHPALEVAAREHADYLDQLRRTTDLLRRQVLLVLREPVHGSTDGLSSMSRLAVLHRRRPRTPVVSESSQRAAEARLVRRLEEASELLAPAGIVVTPLDAGQATAALTAACNPDSLVRPSAGLAGADEIITTAGGDDL